MKTRRVVRRSRRRRTLSRIMPILTIVLIAITGVGAVGHRVLGGISTERILEGNNASTIQEDVIDDKEETSLQTDKKDIIDNASKWDELKSVNEVDILEIELTPLEELYLQINNGDSYEEVLTVLEKADVEYRESDNKDIIYAVASGSGTDLFATSIPVDNLCIQFTPNDNVACTIYTAINDGYEYTIDNTVQQLGTIVTMQKLSEGRNSFGYDEGIVQGIGSKEEGLEKIYTHKMQLDLGQEASLIKKFSNKKLKDALNNIHNYEKLIMNLEPGESVESVLSKIESMELSHEFVVDNDTDGTTLVALDEQQFEDGNLEVRMTVRTQATERGEELVYSIYEKRFSAIERNNTSITVGVHITAEGCQVNIDQIIDGAYERSAIRVDTVEEGVKYANAYLNLLK